MKKRKGMTQSFLKIISLKISLELRVQRLYIIIATMMIITDMSPQVIVGSFVHLMS